MQVNVYGEISFSSPHEGRHQHAVRLRAQIACTSSIFFYRFFGFRDERNIAPSHKSKMAESKMATISTRTAPIWVLDFLGLTSRRCHRNLQALRASWVPNRVIRLCCWNDEEVRFFFYVSFLPGWWVVTDRNPSRDTQIEYSHYIKEENVEEDEYLVTFPLLAHSHGFVSFFLVHFALAAYTLKYPAYV